MAEMFANRAARHEDASVLQLLVGVDMVAEDIEGGVDEGYREVQKGLRSIRLVGWGGGAAEGGHAGQRVVRRSEVDTFRRY